MSAGLPPALDEAIARFRDRVAPKELKSRAEALSLDYRRGAASDAAIGDERDVAAYLTTRFPATYAAIAAALCAVAERMPGFAPSRVLDAGSGPGTASWAAVEQWPKIATVTMLDRNERLLAAARQLAGSSTTASIAKAQFVAGDLALIELAGGYDLVLAGYVFAELPEGLVKRALLNLWNACRGVFVIVEPGTPSGFARMLSCRSVLLGAGARIVAPCPGPYPCPMTPPDWCHFAERLPRSRAHMRAKSARVPFEDEKYSYVAVARETVPVSLPAARIVAPPQAGKPALRLTLCTDSAIRERSVAKREKAAYRAVARKKWGDAL